MFIVVESFNAARSILCGATRYRQILEGVAPKFQCRTQHFMWCNCHRCIEEAPC